MQSDNVAIQIRSRQERAQLADVATPDVEPSPEPDALKFDPRPQTVPKQRHESNAAGTRFVEVGGLGSAGIYGWYRRVLGNVPESMRVADGKLVQPTLHSSVPAYRKIRLIAVHVEGATVNASNPDTFVS